MGSGPPTAEPKWIEATGTAVEVPLGETEPSRAIVYVWDVRTGRAFWRPVRDLAGSWDVSKESPRGLGKVQFRVEREGRPVASASLEVAVGEDVRKRDLTRADRGVIAFYAVPFGEAKVSVRYRVGEEERSMPAQMFPVSAEGSDREPLYVLKVTDPVEVLAEESPPDPPGAKASANDSPTPTEGEEAPTAEQAGPEAEKRDDASTAKRTGAETRVDPLGSALVYVAALILVGLGGFALYRWSKARPEKVEAFLARFGVKTSGGAEPDGGVGPVPGASAPAAPNPPPQILLPGAEPSPIAVSSTPPAATVGSGGIRSPRLVGPAGLVLVLEEGISTVGRDPEVALRIADEPTVSRRHAEIERVGDRVVLRDLGSTNGTFVNGVRVQGEVELRPGDRVQFGAIALSFVG